MAIEQARTNMLSQQLRAWGVLDDQVLDVMQQVPREAFVMPHYKEMAFADLSLPIGHGQVMLPPKEEGRFLQALQIHSKDSILEIGTGTGYFTALLAKLGQQVTSVDIFSDFTGNARSKLTRFNLQNIILETGNAAQGWEKHSQYDVIAITGSLPILPDYFKQALTIGGRLVAVLGQAPAMQATLIQRTSKNSWKQTVLFETVTLPLLESLHPDTFTF